MSVKIKDTGFYGSVPREIQRTTLQTSTGGVIVVLIDPNSANTAGAGYGAKDGIPRLQIWESTDRITFNLRGTYVLTNVSTDPPHWAAELCSDNSVVVAWRTTHATGNYGVAYRKITYGTWASSAEEIVVPVAVAAFAVNTIDITVSPATNVPIVSIAATDNPITLVKHRVYARRTSDNTWVMADERTDSNLGGNYHFGSTASVMNVGTAAARPVVFAWTSVAVDPGSAIRVYSGMLDEATGLITGTTLRDSVGALDSTTTGPVRKILMFRRATNEFVLAGMIPVVSATRGINKFYVSAYRWDGTTWTVLKAAQTYSKTTWVNGDSSIYGGMVFSTSGNLSYINFVHRDDTSINNMTSTLWNNSIRLDFSGATPDQMIGRQYFIKDGVNALTAPSSGGQTFVSGTNYDISYFKTVAGAGFQLHHEYVKPLRAPAGQIPVDGSTVTTSVPSVSMDAITDLTDPPVQVRAYWQIASDVGFTTALKVFEQDSTKWALVNGTVIRTTETLPSSLSLPQGTWYIRSAHRDSLGRLSPYATLNTFTVSHPPAPVQVGPIGDPYVIYGSGGSTNFTWDFTDPSPGDYQTAYQIVVEKVSDGTVVVDSGKVTTTNDPVNPTVRWNAQVVVPAANKDIQLRWKIRLWDKDNVAGNYSAYATFYLVDPATANLTSPASSTVTTSMPTVTLTGTVGGTRRIKKMRVLFLQGATTVYDSGDILVDLASPYTVSHTPTSPILANNQNYTISTYVTDSVGINSSIVQMNITTSWITPAVPTGVTANIVPFNTENQGYVDVSWPSTLRDADFMYWIIRRKADQINPNTLAVVENGLWVELAKIYGISSTYSYRDYYAPAGYKVTYEIAQVVNRFGDIIESADETPSRVTCYPSSEGYWLIEPLATEINASAFKLPQVTADSYTDEYEEAEYPIIGRGRHVDRGERLGLKGTLEVKVRDSTTTTARQMKRRLETLKSENRRLYLRTPFGDLYRVYTGNLSVSRVAGVGKSEFVDITLPYTEVGD